MTERERFETWMRSITAHSLDRNHDGTYMWSLAEWAWRGWQAARRSDEIQTMLTEAFMHDNEQGNHHLANEHAEEFKRKWPSLYEAISKVSKFGEEEVK